MSGEWQKLKDLIEVAKVGAVDAKAPAEVIEHLNEALRKLVEEGQEPRDPKGHS